MSKRELVRELHKPIRRNFKRRNVILKGINDLWQADLVDMGEFVNENNYHAFILTVIDGFSKFAWALPILDKSGNEVTNAMETILIKQSPRNLQTDNGTEFYNVNFKSLMKKYNINHYSTFSSLKASIVERFNKTLKSWMWRKFTADKDYVWADNIKKLVKRYNRRKHRKIRMRPIDVNKKNEKMLLKTVYNNIKTFPIPKFKVDDKVRISKAKHIFEKGYTPNWTTEIFTVDKIKNTNPVTYILKDFENQIIKGGFYEQEISKTKNPDLYLVEKVLKKKANKVFVKWLGFADKFNSWIDKKNKL